LEKVAFPRRRATLARDTPHRAIADDVAERRLSDTSGYSTARAQHHQVAGHRVAEQPTEAEAEPRGDEQAIDGQEDPLDRAEQSREQRTVWQAAVQERCR